MQTTVDYQSHRTAENVAAVATTNRRATNLRSMRKCRGMTAEVMGKKCGILRNFLVEMENGQRSISIRTIDRIARGLGIESHRVLAELDR